MKANPKSLNLFDSVEMETIEIDMDTVDRIIIVPARELMASNTRILKGIDATDMVVRVQFKKDASKEYSLRKYDMEFIYP